VAAYEFFFTLELARDATADAMLSDLASNVLGHVGCSCDAVPELVGVLQRAVAEGATCGADRCNVQFRAYAGELHIVVSFGADRVWRTSRPIP